MRVFLTGGSGWIGRGVVPLLVADGHEVVGLARSERAADVVHSLGAQAIQGSLEDTDLLRSLALGSGGTIHLGYNHDFAEVQAAAELDRRAINAIGEALAGSGKPLLIASGVLGLAAPGEVATELDRPMHAHPRSVNAEIARSFTAQDVRAVVVRFPPTVHGDGDHGFISTLVAIAREKGCAGYITTGANRWSAVHRDDAASAIRLALVVAPPGSTLHVVAEEAVSTRSIAEAIGAGLSLPVVAISEEDAPSHFGWMARLFALDGAASSNWTRETLGWRPQGPGLLDDLASGSYFR